MTRLICLLMLLPWPLAAQTLVATRVLRAQSVLGAQDLTLVPGQANGALSAPTQAIGQEARVTLYPGRPIRAADLVPPALVERNQLVTLLFRRGNLQITAEGRALSRGGSGARIRVMNLQSRSTVTGEVGADGQITVIP